MLTTQEITSFQQDGFIGPLRAFTPEEMDSLIPSLDPILNGNEASHHRHLDNRSVYEICSADTIIQRISSLFGNNILLWGSNFFVKDPGGKGTPWHQDHNYGIAPTLEPPLNISVWLAIDDVRIENSCMKFISGSHLKVVPHNAPEAGQYFGKADVSEFDLSQAVNMELSKGEFVIFTDRVIHGASDNESSLRRAGLAMRFTLPFVKILRNIQPILVSGVDDFGFNELKMPPKVV